MNTTDHGLCCAAPSRRQFLAGSLGLVFSGGLLGAGPGSRPPRRAAAAVPADSPAAAAPPVRKSSARIAAIVTEYRPLSHADVILTRLVEDYALGTRPVSSPVRLHSMYVEQFPERDMARWVARAYGVRLAETIRDAVLEDGKVAVDAVWLIGEHGDYPYNDRGQCLYPRRRFFEGTVAAFREAGAVVPVFNDKHLSARWEDSKFMYDTARAMEIPFMAGSSLPLAWRRPPLELPLETPLEEALVAGFGGLESYGFHALETLQCMVERRRGGETGVASVECLEGEAVWKAADDGVWSRDLLEAALARQGTDVAGKDLRGQGAAAFVLRYRDGLRATVLMLDSLARHFLFAARLPGQRRPVSTQFWLQEPVYGHFSYLARAISELTLAGAPPYPVERTLLTSGVLCRAMDSRFEGHRAIETPELAIAYRGVDHGLGAYGDGEGPSDRDGHWVELLDGDAPGNWRENVWEGEPRWELRDGVLRGSGGKGYLATLEELEDFELFAELRVWDEAGGRGNSGIYLRCAPHADRGVEYPAGYEVQVDHGDRNNSTGSIYAMGPGARAPRVITRDREWFTLRVRAEGPRLRTWVNAEPMVDWTDPEYRRRSGYLLLQQHHATGVVEVRELRARRL
jgi:hypothetical protein